jgi:hydroxyacylglutathione hydrolase
VAFVTPETLTRYFDRGGASETIEQATFAQVAEWQDRDDMAVVDVRFAAEFAAGHVPGAVNASYTRLPSYARERIPEGKTLLVHCASGGRSAPAAAYLAREGFQVRYVDGEFSTYQAMADVVTEDPAVAA